jgi:hypothetical protein
MERRPRPVHAGATVVVLNPQSRRDTPGADRRFFSGVAVALALSVFAGFAPTYYLKNLYGTPVLSLFLHVHGMLFTLWILLFVTQTTLVAARRTDLHRRLGIVGGVLAVAMLVVGTAVAVAAAKRGQFPGNTGTAGQGIPLEGLATPLGGLTIFAVLVTLGFYYRRNRDSHKRLMMLATIGTAIAGLDRLLFPTGLLAFSGLPLNTLTSLGLTAVFLLACFVYDWRTRGHVHPAFLWGGISTLAWAYATRELIPRTAAWLAFAGWLTH